MPTVAKHFHHINLTEEHANSSFSCPMPLKHLLLVICSTLYNLLHLYLCTLFLLLLIIRYFWWDYFPSFISVLPLLFRTLLMSRYGIHKQSITVTVKGWNLGCTMDLSIKTNGRILNMIAHNPFQNPRFLTF